MAAVPMTVEHVQGCASAGREIIDVMTCDIHYAAVH